MGVISLPTPENITTMFTFHYALSDHVFLQSTSQLNHTTYSSDVTPDTSYGGEGLTGALFSLLFADWDLSLQTQLYTEAGIGYYLPFLENFIFETWVGVGWGRNRLAEAGLWDWDQIDFYKLFVQVDIGVREKYFDFGFGYRESYLNQYNIELEDEGIGRTNILFHGDHFIFAAAGQENYGEVYFKLG